MRLIEEFLQNAEDIAAGIMNNKERMDIYRALETLKGSGNGEWTRLTQDTAVTGNEYVARFIAGIMTPAEREAKVKASRTQAYQAAVDEEMQKLRIRQDALGQMLDTDHQPRTLLAPSDIARLPDKQWVVENQIPDSSLLVYYYGLPEQGKSLVTLRLGHSICTGSADAFGFAVAKRTPVLYIDTEGRWDLKERMAAIEEHTGVPFPAEGFRAISEESVVFASRVNIERLIREVSSVFPLGCGLVVVVDTQAGVTEGVNENAAEMMSPVIANFLLMAKAFGGPIVVVHHSGKDGGDLRGSSAMRGRARVIYEVRSGRVVCEKFNGHDKSKCGFEFKITPVGGSVVAAAPDPVSAEELEARKKALAVAKNVWEWILKNHENGQDYTQTEITTQVSASIPSVTKRAAASCIKTFIEDGLVWLQDGMREVGGDNPRTMPVKYVRPHRGLGNSYGLWVDGGAEALREYNRSENPNLRLL